MDNPGRGDTALQCLWNWNADSSSQFTRARRAALHDTLAQLELVNRTPAKEYSIYRIP